MKITITTMERIVIVTVVRIISGMLNVTCEKNLVVMQRLLISFSFLKNALSFSRKIALRSPFSMQFLFGDKEFSTHSELCTSVLSVKMNARVQINQTRAMYSNRRFEKKFEFH